MKNIESLANMAAAITVNAAIEYLKRKNLSADPGELVTACKAYTKASLREAITDAKEALDCHMEAAAVSTFKASMILAGIRAAREVAKPTREPLLVDVFDGFYKEAKPL